MYSVSQVNFLNSHHDDEWTEASLKLSSIYGFIHLTSSELPVLPQLTKYYNPVRDLKIIQERLQGLRMEPQD